MRVMEIHEAIREMEMMDKGLVPALKDITNRSVHVGATIAGRLVKVDIGELRDNILMSPEISESNDFIEGFWGSDLHYDFFVEYGHEGIPPNWHHRTAWINVVPDWESRIDDVIINGPGVIEGYPEMGRSGIVLRRS